MLGLRLIAVLSVVGGALSYHINCAADVDAVCGKRNEDWEGQTWPEDQEQLEKACNAGDVLDCQIDYAKNCPKSLLRPFLDYLEETKVVHHLLCGDDVAFKQKYFENIKCLNDQGLELFKKCKESTKNNPADLCGHIIAVRECVSQGIFDKCGEVAHDVYNIVSKPFLTIEKILCKKGIKSKLSFSSPLFQFLM